MQKGSRQRVPGRSRLSIISKRSPFPEAAGRRRGGYSLVEILVAVTLLLIITVIISMVFQQAGGAWASGSALTKSESAIRAVLGSVERDLLNAVDARDYGMNNPSDEGDSATIEFVALQHLYDHKNPRDSGRTPCLITYTYNAGEMEVFRTMAPLRFVSEGAPWAVDNASDYATDSVVNGGLPLTDVVFTPIRPDNNSSNLPLRVEITAEAPRSITLFTISGRSFGKNRQPEAWDDTGSDDIRVGGKL